MDTLHLYMVCGTKGLVCLTFYLWNLSFFSPGNPSLIKWWLRCPWVSNCKLLLFFTFLYIFFHPFTFNTFTFFVLLSFLHFYFSTFTFTFSNIYFNIFTLELLLFTHSNSGERLYTGRGTGGVMTHSILRRRQVKEQIFLGLFHMLRKGPKSTSYNHVLQLFKK